VPFIHKVLLQGEEGEEIELEAVIDNGAMASALNTETYEAARKAFGKLAWSPRILRMANGELVRSRGSWSGEVTLGGVTRRRVLEVFLSGGAWAMLFGKPLLEGFAAWHGYEKDVILLRTDDGATVRIENAHAQARGKADSVMTVTEAAMHTNIPGGSSAPPVRQAPSPTSNAPVEWIDQPAVIDVSAQTKENKSSAHTSNWWRASDTKSASIAATRGTTTGGDSAPPTRQVPDPTPPVAENPNEHSVTEGEAEVADLPVRKASDTKPQEPQKPADKHAKRKRGGCRE
jgi:hypothetical protein